MFLWRGTKIVRLAFDTNPYDLKFGFKPRSPFARLNIMINLSNERCACLMDDNNYIFAQSFLSFFFV